VSRPGIGDHSRVSNGLATVYQTHAHSRFDTYDALPAPKLVSDRLCHVNPEGFAFSHDPGGAEPWRPNYATLAFGRLADEQGLKGVRLHDLRHFAATTMLVSGIDIRTASGRLGHANASTTLDIYSHFVAAADERAASAVADVLDR
jgi:integrase